jgi:hypothetical protein
MRLATLAALLLACPAAAAAQATGDQARLVFTVSGGYAAGHSLWQVTGQPVVLNGLTDLLDLERQLTGTWTAGLGAIYFKNPNIGFTVDAHLVDLAQRTDCRLLSNSGSTLNPQVCESLDGTTSSSMSVAVSAGAVLRAASRGAVSPFLRLQGGAFFGSLNTTQVVGSYETATGEPSLVFVYPNESTNSFSPQFMVGVGVTIPASRAYHIRFEGRAHTFGLDVIEGATLSQDVPPPVSKQYLTQFSLHLGVDLVLERKRGRRY